MSFPADLAPGTADDLYLLCAELLEAAKSAVALARGGAISRCFVSAGLPPFDCVSGGQLTVHAGGPLLADTAPLQPPLQPAHRVQEGLQVNLINVTVTVIRCAIMPSGQTQALPDPALMSEVAAITMADCWAIWNWCAEKKRADLLFAPKWREMYFDPAVALQTSGGASGWQLGFRVQLNGSKIGP